MYPLPAVLLIKNDAAKPFSFLPVLYEAKFLKYPSLPIEDTTEPPSSRSVVLVMIFMVPPTEDIASLEEPNPL